LASSRLLRRREEVEFRFHGGRNPLLELRFERIRRGFDALLDVVLDVRSHGGETVPDRHEDGVEIGGLDLGGQMGAFAVVIQFQAREAHRVDVVADRPDRSVIDGIRVARHLVDVGRHLLRRLAGERHERNRIGRFVQRVAGANDDARVISVELRLRGILHHCDPICLPDSGRALDSELLGVPMGKLAFEHGTTQE
jgi:hypothetical protein